MKRTKELKLYSELPPNEIRKALRKQIQPYQLENFHRLTSGKDHWKWFIGKEDPDPETGQWDNRMKFLWLHAKKGISPEMRLRKLELTTKGKPVIAFLVDSRWVARCPDCNGQEVVEPTTPIFVCLNPVCFDRLNNYWPRPIKFPTKEEQEKIKSILLLRINPINRNWFPTKETIKDLEQENQEHGLPKNLEELHGGKHNGLEHTIK